MHISHKKYIQHCLGSTRRREFYFGGCIGDRIGCSDAWPLSGRGHGRNTSDILLGSRASFGPRAEVEGAVVEPRLCHASWPPSTSDMRTCGHSTYLAPAPRRHP